MPEEEPAVRITLTQIYQKLCDVEKKVDDIPETYVTKTGLLKWIGGSVTGLAVVLGIVLTVIQIRQGLGA